MSNKVIIPFRWAGGKYYALKKLRQFWENHPHTEYREPFFGGGSVFFAKEKVDKNWINDIDEDLVNTLKNIQNKESRNRLLEFFEGELEATKEKYEQVKNFSPVTSLEKAYKYYYLNRTSFSGKMKNPSWGYRPKRSLPPYRWKERILPCGEKLENVKITSIDFEKVIMEDSPDKVLIFLDPPYFNAKQESHYVHFFKTEDHIRLAETCKKTRHDFFLTYDDCPEVRELYNWANIYDLKFFYRLDNSKDNEDKRKVGSELVITNYEIDVDRYILKDAVKPV
ncbi:DNA adenine methylase [Coprobacter sp.]